MRADGYGELAAASVSASFTAAPAVVSLHLFRARIPRQDYVAEGGNAFQQGCSGLPKVKGRTCVRPFNSPEIGLIGVVAVPLLQRVAVVIAV
jgi:hypothetical protein